VSLPAWLTPLPAPAEQRALDAWAIDQLGTPGLELMERAGGGLARVTAELAPSGAIVVVCGKGNNGGDGYVAARLLRDQSRDVLVLSLVDPGELTGDAATVCGQLPGEGPQPFETERLTGAAVIVDAILGTGFSGAPRESAKTAIAAINRCEEAAVVACDIPSGVDGTSGEVQGEAIRAAATATFHAGKPGLWIAPGKAHAGEVRVIDIGIPDGGPGAPTTGLIEPAACDGIPRRGSDSSKFAAGSVLVCGGSTGLTGAPTLASRAAMRAGSGYVTACIPASLNAILEVKLTEVMTVPIPDAEGAITPAAVETVLTRAERVQAVVLGPGLGRDPGSQRFARELAARVGTPLLIDADALFAHNERLESLAARPAVTVLTPHAGELARLLGCDSAEIAAHRLRCVREAAARSQAIVVLKGDDTLIADPAGRVAVSRGGAPALATAGTGDVLSGVIGAYLGKGMDPFHAACAGVFVHAAAGRECAAAIGDEGVIAGDVIEALPRALASAAEHR
jgi:hydroxyethylthiazole kinase-like uncharacterized protein yjeF